LRDDSGRRIRKFFASRDAASEWLGQRRPELKNQGRAAIGMTDRQRVDAVRALAILAPYAATLTAAAEAFADRAEILSRTVTFQVLREEVLVAKKADKKSEVYQHDLFHRLSKFGDVFDSRQVASIETPEIDDWLRSLPLAPSSRFNYRKVLRTAFEFAVTRGYARDNPVVKAARVKIELPPPGIMTPKEIAALLTAADPLIVPSLAIAAFAGIRDAELGRMNWDKIDLSGGYLKVDASVSKNSSRRVIPMADNLREWLAPYAKKTGPIRPSFGKFYALKREAKGTAVEALQKDGEPSSNLQEWPNNVLRHSFASYRMAIVPNAAQVAEECGNSPQILKQNYRELVTKHEAEAWFSVKPAADASKVIQFTKSAG
jgi:integrase